MEKHKLTRKITEWKSTALRPRGRFKMRCEEDVKYALKVMKIYHWKRKAKSRNEF
jgi:hypothetical protein